MPAAVSEQTVAQAEASLSRPGVPIEPRRQWPAAMAGLGVQLTGKIAAGELAEPGRVIARYTDLGYGQRVRSVLSPASTSRAPGPDEATRPDTVPADLVSASIQVLAAWQWQQRPVAVAWVGSHRRPGLIADLAGQLAGRGRLANLGPVEHLGQSATSRTNSAQRLRSVAGGYRIGPALAEALAGEFAGQPILLVDDFIDTGWTVAVLARLLRQAGAGRVLPFALGQAG